MDFFVIITVLLLVMVTLSLLSLWNYQYLWLLFSYLSDMTHFGVKSYLQKCLYFDLSFIVRVLTSPVHQDPCLSSWKCSLRGQLYAWPLHVIHMKVKSPRVTIKWTIHQHSALAKTVNFMFMAKARLQVRKTALLRPWSFSEEKESVHTLMKII